MLVDTNIFYDTNFSYLIFVSLVNGWLKVCT